MIDHTAQILNTLGLALTILGSGILWKFGLAADVDPQGRQFLELEQTDTTEVQKSKLYALLGRIGFGLICGGSTIQLVAIWI